jgi:hypothetical protein
MPSFSRENPHPLLVIFTFLLERKISPFQVDFSFLFEEGEVYIMDRIDSVFVT